MTIGGRNPPRPPAAPTRPVTLPTWATGTRVPTMANTAPLPRPSAAAMVRKATVATAMLGWKAVTTAPAATTPRAHRITGTPVLRSAGARAGEPAPDGAGQGGQDHEPGRPAGRVGGFEAVESLQERGQVDAEGPEPAEGDGVDDGQVAGDGQPGRGPEPGHERLGGLRAVGGVAAKDQEGHTGHGQEGGYDQERPGPAPRVGHP